MPYAPYATKDYYLQTYGGTSIPDEEIDKALKQASRNIDSLTYNRIVGQGFDTLTEFQQEIVRETVCMQAEFEYDNADSVASALSGYSINGVSAQFGLGVNAELQNGIMTRKDIYSLLKQTGLCCRLAVP